MSTLPVVVADLPLAQCVIDLLNGRVDLLPWESLEEGADVAVQALYTFGHPVVDAAVLDALPALRVISNHGVGVDHIDLAAASARRIPVGNTPGILNGATADMAFALLMAAARRLVEADHFARGPQFTSYDPAFLPAREVHGATLGIVGMGRIGAQIARRARGFDMTILYHNRHRREDAEAELGATYVTFTELLARSDYVVTSTVLTDATRGLIGREELAQMKPTATLVNIARGPIVDTNALTEALGSGQIHAAALDVTDPEPLPRDHPLLGMPNLVIAPHLGSNTIETRQRMAEVSIENLMLGLAGEPLVHEVS